MVFKPIAKFIESISKSEKTVEQIKKTKEENSIFYIKKEDAIMAFKERELEIKGIMFKYFDKESQLSEDLGFVEKDGQE